MYEGDKANGVPHGSGTMIYRDNSIYKGEWRFGMMHGYITYN